MDFEDKAYLSQFQVPATKESAFTAILLKYQERLYWHIRRMLVDHEDTNDVLQNVAIKIWNGLANFREDAQLYTWLYRIATNEALTALDKQKRNKTVNYEDEAAVMMEKVQADSNFDANRLEWKLQLAIQQLPEKQRLVFNLRYFDEMPYSKMSLILDTSEGALKASYHHAAKKIEDFILHH